MLPIPSLGQQQAVNDQNNNNVNHNELMLLPAAHQGVGGGRSNRNKQRAHSMLSKLAQAAPEGFYCYIPELFEKPNC